MQQFEGGRRGNDFPAVGSSGGAPTPVTEGGPQPFAAGQQLFDRSQPRKQLRADVGQHRPLAVKEVLKHRSDLVTDAGKACCAGCHVRDTSPAGPRQRCRVLAA